MTNLRMVSYAALIATMFATSSAALAAGADFTGPANWSPSPPAAPSATRKVMQWHIAGDTSTSVTYIEDSAASYADALTAIQKNFSDNKIKPAVDKDEPCHGQTAHVIEFTFGPNGSRTVINRLLIPDGKGLATITYTRADGNDFDADVKKAETAYCGGS